MLNPDQVASIRTVAIDIACSRCSKTVPTRLTAKDAARLPRSWKRAADSQPVCDSCWGAAYVIRAVTIPVAECIEGGTKDEMWTALRACWAASTAAANEAVKTLARNDLTRKPADDKLGKMPATYLYGAIPPASVGMDPRSHTCLLTAVERRYRKDRFSLVWVRNRSVPLYRYPVPYPLPPDQWRVGTGAGGEPLVETRFGGRWWTLRLRGGHEFRRLLASHKKIETKEAVPVEAALFPDDDGKRIMCKMVAWFPRMERPARSGEMLIATGGDRMLTATVAGRDPWVLHADHVRRWIAEHDARRWRLATDLKYEKRWPKHTREAMVEAGADRCKKQHDRLTDWIGVSTKMVAEFAARQNVAVVRYNDTDRTYFASFPWARWSDTLAQKLDALGIALVRESEGGEIGHGAHSQETQTEQTP